MMAGVLFAGWGVAAGGGAEGKGALVDGGDIEAEGTGAAGAEFGLCFFTKSAKGSAVTAGAVTFGLGAPAVVAPGLAAVASAGTSGVTGLLCKAPFGFQSLFFCASTASWSAERDMFLLLKGMGTLVTYMATPRAMVRPMTKPRTKPSKVPPR